MNNDIKKLKCYNDSKEVPKDYIILKLKMLFNKELFEDKIITFDIYNKMQELLISKMNKIIIEVNN